MFFLMFPLGWKVFWFLHQVFLHEGGRGRLKGTELDQFVRNIIISFGDNFGKIDWGLIVTPE